VGTPGRPVELAGDAPLHANRDSVDLDVPVKWRPEIVVPIFVGVCCKKQNEIFIKKNKSIPPNSREESD
jgi:hypothetical protein